MSAYYRGVNESVKWKKISSHIFHRIFCVLPPTVNFIKSHIQPAILTHSMWAMLRNIVHIDVSIEWTVCGCDCVTCGETIHPTPPSVNFMNSLNLPSKLAWNEHHQLLISNQYLWIHISAYVVWFCATYATVSVLVLTRISRSLAPSTVFVAAICSSH